MESRWDSKSWFRQEKNLYGATAALRRLPAGWQLAWIDRFSGGCMMVIDANGGQIHAGRRGHLGAVHVLRGLAVAAVHGSEAEGVGHEDQAQASSAAHTQLRATGRVSIADLPDDGSGAHVRFSPQLERDARGHFLDAVRVDAGFAGHLFCIGMVRQESGGPTRAGLRHPGPGGEATTATVASYKLRRSDIRHSYGVEIRSNCFL